jgi:hypothetical protein
VCGRWRRHGGHGKTRLMVAALRQQSLQLPPNEASGSGQWSKLAT